MSNDLIAFTFDATAVRVIDRDGDPWFAATDVASVLGYRDAEKLTRLLDEDEKGTLKVGTLGGEQELVFVSEAGLYHAAFRSRSPAARQLRRWVTHDVLPTLRTTGSYGLQRQTMPLDRGIRYMLRLYDALKTETDVAVRQSLHTALDRVLTAIDVPTPPLASFDTPQLVAQRAVQATLDLFWERVEWLSTQEAAPLNHHRDGRFVAYSLPEVESRCARAGLSLPPTGELRAALRLDARFVGNKTVNSGEGKSVQCWVFQAVGAAALE